MYSAAIVGLGHVAEHQISAIEHCSAIRLVAGCDSDSSRFSILDRSVETFTDIEELVKVDALDMIIIASPNKLHVDHGLQVMEAGKWLLMEKPLAETPAEFARFAAGKESLAGRCTLALHAAFGVEVTWFRNERESSVSGSADLASFDARFYDPYFESGVVSRSALSLGGSWVDSGINALSVVCQFLDADSLEIADSRMTRVAGTECSEVQGTVDFQWDRGARLCRGSIDTNWTLGRNSKSTLLRFAEDDCAYLLEHSRQSVFRIGGRKAAEVFVNTNGRPRLTNHYIGVFADLIDQIDRGRDNFEYGAALHSHLYEALAWNGQFT